MKLKEKSKKAGLKLNIQKTKIMAPGLITPRQIDGETVEIVADFIFLGSRITSDMQMTPPLWQKVKKNFKSLLMKVKEESEKLA